MTEPSEAAKRKACELANAHVATGVARWRTGDVYPYAHTAPLYALALHLDEVDSKMREIVALSGPNCQRAIIARSLMLPDPVDPDEELAREVAEYLEAPCDRALIQSALRRLRELGKLVKETPDD